MNIACMQPYFLPYIGYFQLISAVDKFVVYDNIKYTKKGWINRNRMLLNGCPEVFSLPLKKDSDYLNVVDRQISSDFDHRKLLNNFRGAYAQALYNSSRKNCFIRICQKLKVAFIQQRVLLYDKKKVFLNIHTFNSY